jgi:glycosyltransferase involved in cell wall biosynthesis
VLAGDGAQRAALEQAARGAGVAEQVHMLGWRDDIRDLHTAFSLFTMSSRSEGTSVSLLEAMSAGLCPVVTDVGGNAAVLGPALRHRLVPPADPDALAMAWRDALVDADRRAADGAAARQRVKSVYSLEEMVRRYESLYEGRR